jgi:hypothetical protein
MTWTSVFVMGVVISSALVRVLAAGVWQAYRLVHP